VEYYRDTVDPLWRQIYRETLLLNADGTLSPPERPGLGLELNTEALAPYRVA
jgi:L-alanine-DL-glutamate epimerase-like enolase superfamily enzyme